MPILSKMLRPELIDLDLRAADDQAALGSLCTLIERAGLVDAAGRELLLGRLIERERLGGTCVGAGAAIPHAALATLPELLLVLGRLSAPIHFGPTEAERADIVLLLAGPGNDPERHLQVISKLCRMLKDNRFLTDLRRASAPQDVLQAFEQVEQRHN